MRRRRRVKTAWYSIHGMGTPATVITTGSGFDTVLFVYASWPFGPAVACNDDVSATDLTSSLTFPTTAGTRYLIQAGSACHELAWPCLAANAGTLRILATMAPNPDVDGDTVVSSQFGGTDCNDYDARIRPGALDIPRRDRPELRRPRRGCAAAQDERPRHPDHAPSRDLHAGREAHGVERPRRRHRHRLVHEQEARLQVLVEDGQHEGHQDAGARQDRRQVAHQGQAQEGAKIEVRITSAGQIGTVTRFTFRKGKTPTKATLCLPPGARKPQKVCS
jgi:hypothetical protein